MTIKNSASRRSVRKNTKLLCIVLAFAMSFAILAATDNNVSAADWDGKATYKWHDEGSPTNYTISTASDLKGFANIVNGYDGRTAKNFENQTVSLGASVDLSGKKWAPIGDRDTYKFGGKFDGRNYTISNFSVDPGKYLGLFGYVTNTGSVLNLKVGTCNFTCTGNEWSAGGVVGYLDGGKVADCSFIGKMTSTVTVKFVATNTDLSATGGVVGTNKGVVDRCTSSGNITVNGVNGAVGGIIGNNYMDVGNCSNTGAVKVKGQDVRVGGIIGNNVQVDLLLSDRVNHQITKCHNTGNISADGLSYTYHMAGGIVGADDDGDISDCYNTGVITVAGTSENQSYAGGITSSTNYGKIKDCYNTGRIVGGVDSSVGGIVGNSSDNLTNCFNKAVLSTGAGGTCGGLAGHVTLKESFKNCYNNGAVNGGADANCGGLVGCALKSDLGSDIKVINCYNSGVVKTSGNGLSGGLIGKIKIGAVVTTQYCYWLSATGTSVKAFGSAADFVTPATCAYFKGMNDRYTYNGTAETFVDGKVLDELNSNRDGLHAWYANADSSSKLIEYPQFFLVAMPTEGASNQEGSGGSGSGDGNDGGTVSSGGMDFTLIIVIVVIVIVLIIAALFFMKKKGGKGNADGNGRTSGASDNGAHATIIPASKKKDENKDGNNSKGHRPVIIPVPKKKEKDDEEGKKD